MPQVSQEVTQNYRRSFASSNFGTRKLAFYQFMVDPNAGMIGQNLSAISFRVNTTTGVVTHTTPGQYMNSMADVDYSDYYAGGQFSYNDVSPEYADDGILQLGLPFNISFLGTTGIDTIYIDSNSIIYFGAPSTYSREGAGDPSLNGNGVPGIAIANSDGYVSYLLYNFDSGTGKVQIKFNGNTNYEDPLNVNLVWEAQFDANNPEYIDILITHQSYNWNDYGANGTRYPGDNGTVWGVTSGSGWIDGITGSRAVFTAFGDFTTSGGDNWKESDSLYHNVVRALQLAGAELYWLGQPHNSQETFEQNWDPIIPIPMDGFVFAIADDASSPTASLQDALGVEATETNTLDPNSIKVSGAPAGVEAWFETGMPLKFSGNVFGGIVADKTYYLRQWYANGDGTYAIFVSDTVDPNVQDITYPDGFGGTPGQEVELTTDTGSMTVTFLYYDKTWQGTAGDFEPECCGDVSMPGIQAMRLNYYINRNVDFGGPYMWWTQRLNPTYGLFPGCWARNLP